VGPDLVILRRVRVGRRLRGSAEEKGRRRNGRELSVPTRADEARGRGAYVAVFIGGTLGHKRHATPQNRCGKAVRAAT